MQSMVFFCVINSKSIHNDAHKFSANTAETALFNFLDCWHQHLLLLSTFSDATSFPCPVPFASQGCWFKICPVRSQRKYHVITRSNWPNQHFVSTFWMLKFRVLRHDYNLSFTPYLHPRNLWRASSQATQDLDIGPQVQIESSIPTT